MTGNLNQLYWSEIGKLNENSYGIGTFGDGGLIEEQYRHYFEVENLKKIVGFKKNLKVLDLGCGTGRIGFALANNINKYVGIDYSEIAIKQAKNVASKLNINNMEFKKGSILDFDSNEKFDLIYLGAVTQYLSDEEFYNLLNRINKFVKDDGVIVERSTTYSNYRHVADSILYFCTYRTINEIKRIYEENEFKYLYNKPSYEFLKGTNKLTRMVYKYFKNKKLKNILAYLNTKVFNILIYNDKKENSNYISHDYIVFGLNMEKKNG